MYLVNKALAKRTNTVCQTFRTLLVKHACPFGHHDKHFLTSTFCLSMFLKLVTSKKCLSSTCLCSGQTNKYCARQAKLQMFAKQCLSIWPGLNPMSRGVNLSFSYVGGGAFWPPIENQLPQ